MAPILQSWKSRKVSISQTTAIRANFIYAHKGKGKEQHNLSDLLFLVVVDVYGLTNFDFKFSRFVR